MIQFTLFSFHTAPLGRNFMSFQEKPETRMFLGLAPDRTFLGFMHSLSKGGSLARTPPAADSNAYVFDPQGDFILKYMVAEIHMSSEAGRETAYRTISGWSVAALLLGILSGAAVVGPILWLIPVFGVAVSWIALAKIKRSEGQLSGWGVAVLGLLLAIFFGAAGPARAITRHVWLESRAENFAQAFNDLLKHDKPFAAHQLTRNAASRKPFAVEEPDPYAKDADTKKDYDAFLKLDAVKLLLGGAEAKLFSANYAMGDERSDIVAVTYRLSAQSSEIKPMEALMYLERTLAYGTQTEQWRVITPAFRPLEPK